MQQWHVSRRIAPLIPGLIPVFVEISKRGGSKSLDALSGISETLSAFADGISSMSDEHSEYVLYTCLGVVRRLNGQNWVPVWSAQHKAMMFEDIDLAVMIQLTVKVIIENLEPFIRGLLTRQDSPI